MLHFCPRLLSLPRQAHALLHTVNLPSVVVNLQSSAGYCVGLPALAGLPQSDLQWFTSGRSGNHSQCTSKFPTHQRNSMTKPENKTPTKPNTTQTPKQQNSRVSALRELRQLSNWASNSKSSCCPCLWSGLVLSGLVRTDLMTGACQRSARKHSSISEEAGCQFSSLRIGLRRLCISGLYESSQSSSQ